MSHELVDGRFRIVRVIGRGNMGEVHQAEDLRAPEGSPERMVAVKTILRRRTGGRIDASSDTKAVERFTREVGIMRHLDHHPNLTRIIEGGIAADCDGLPYLAMEFLDGASLRDLKRLVLTEYDRMATAGLSLEKPLLDGETYTSPLTPPPGHGPRHEGAGR